MLQLNYSDLIGHGRDMMITVNGKPEEFEAKISLLEFLETKDINPDSVVVEHNLNIVEKEELDNIRLKENDTLEVLRFVGGG